MCWGSFERNTGQWCPFVEQDEIEAAFRAGQVQQSHKLPSPGLATVTTCRHPLALPGPMRSAGQPPALPPGCLTGALPIQGSILLPNCFNATVHFAQQHCHQSTPAFGAKPAGFRSVLRGEVGSIVRLHYWSRSKTFRLDRPT